MEESRALALQQLLRERGLLGRGADTRTMAAYRTALAERDRAEQALSRTGEARAQAQHQLQAAQEGTTGPLPPGGTVEATGPGGSPALRITNPSRRSSFAEQSVALDGQRVQFVDLQARIRWTDVVLGPQAWQGAVVRITFHNASGAQVGGVEGLDIYTGRSDWRLVSKQFQVPANTARVVVHLGLDNCTGSVWYADVRLTADSPAPPPATSPAPFGTPVSVTPDAQNLLVNGDFTVGRSGWTLPSGVAVENSGPNGRPALRVPGESGPTELAQKQAALDAATRDWETAQSVYTRARLRVDDLRATLMKHAHRALAPPLSLAQAHRSLPAGTLFLAFVVSQGGEQGYLFLLRGAGDLGTALAAFPIQGLASPMSPLRTQCQRLSDPMEDTAATVAAGRALFAQLFPPEARNAIAQAKRLLISPDGPLWEVPFAALVTNQQGPPRYLGLEKPISFTPSLTLFAQARRDRPHLAPGRKPAVLVVGDPRFSRQSPQVAAVGAPAPAVRGERALLLRDGRAPAPLPATRVEATQIARLYGGQPLLGEAATEAAVRQRIERADVVHLATHGYLHPLRAMSSGLLLSVPEREPEAGQTGNDGVLQAWEIYSQLKLQAELVVLSACETGHGEPVAGEGIVGLTRALQYAGARSILASRWKVADGSTAALMVGFHRGLRAGRAKDEALQAAMAAVQREGTTAAPYYWAPFFLLGDPENPSLGIAAATRGEARGCPGAGGGSPLAPRPLTDGRSSWRTVRVLLSAAFHRGAVRARLPDRPGPADLQPGLARDPSRRPVAPFLVTALPVE